MRPLGSFPRPAGDVPDREPPAPAGDAPDGKPPASAVRRIPARRVVLACGHSARDTFEAVRAAGAAMERKPFSAGVRIEHPQPAIDRAQYGHAAGHPALGAADYKLAAHLPDGRGVYTFCMCPGGQVVAAASEEGGVVVNGMSRFARDGEEREQRPSGGGAARRSAGRRRAGRRGVPAAHGARGLRGGPRGGRRAVCRAPLRRWAAFCQGAPGEASRTVRPSYPRGVAWCDLRACLPPFIADALADALPLLDRKLRGFADDGAVMTGVETRSSSPVRILRDEGFPSPRARERGCRVRQLSHCGRCVFRARQPPAPARGGGAKRARWALSMRRALPKGRVRSPRGAGCIPAARVRDMPGAS